MNADAFDVDGDDPMWNAQNLTESLERRSLITPALEQVPVNYPPSAFLNWNGVPSRPSLAAADVEMKWHVLTAWDRPGIHGNSIAIDRVIPHRRYGAIGGRLNRAFPSVAVMAH
jgi:hypothetical protein